MKLTGLLWIALGVSLGYNLYVSLSSAVLKDAQGLRINALTEENTRLAAEVSRLKKRQSAEDSAERATIDQLKAAVAAQKDLADAADRRLAQARNGGLPSEADRARVEDSLTQERRYIQDLEQQLKAEQGRLAALSGEDRATAAQASLGQARDNQALTAQIQAAQARSRDIVAAIQAEKKSFDFDRQEKLQKLQTQLQAEKDGITQLQAQRGSVVPAWGAQKEQARAETQARREQLQASMRQLQAQLATEKQNLGKLQGDLDQSRKTRQSAQQSMAGLENDDRAQRTKLQELRKRLDEETQRLGSTGQ